MKDEYIPEDVKEGYREYLASKHKDDGFKERFTSALQTIAQQSLSGSPDGSPKYLGSINSLTEGEIARVQNWRCGKCKWYYEPKDFA